jgi:hypothetical protein
MRGVIRVPNAVQSASVPNDVRSGARVATGPARVTVAKNQVLRLRAAGAHRQRAKDRGDAGQRPAPIARHGCTHSAGMIAVRKTNRLSAQ